MNVRKLVTDRSFGRICGIARRVDLNLGKLLSRKLRVAVAGDEYGCDVSGKIRW